MRERVFGIETEYALIYHPRGDAEARPTNLELYRRFETALAQRVLSLPHGFSPLRSKGGRFLENGGTFHYEATASDYEHGLLELASPECRDPFDLVHHERAKDELVEELADEVNAKLALAGFRGEVRIGKNNTDSEGHTFGSHESYWVDDPLGWRLVLFAPIWLALWSVSAPIVGLVLVAQIAVILALFGFGIGLLFAGGLVRLFSSRASQGVFRFIERTSRRLDAHPGDFARRLQWLVTPIYPLLDVHSFVYNRFHFRGLKRFATAHLVTRTLFTGSGAIAFDGGPLVRLAQRPPFLKAFSRIFPDGDERPLFETRDLFFRPWSALLRRRRLHLLIGDANMNECAQLLRVGTTALVLEAIESGAELAWPELVDPLAALRELNADPDLERPLACVGGERKTALAIQTEIIALVRAALASRLAEGWRAEVMDAWSEVVRDLARDPEIAADRVDWLAKRTLIRAAVPDAEDRRALEASGSRWLGEQLPADGETRRLRELGFRAWRTDLRYHELGPRGDFRKLEARGRVRRITDPARVERARLVPPRDTRAWGRGRAIRWANQHALPGRAEWHRVRVGKWDWRFFRDPLEPGSDPADADGI